ncbi:4Fe-4S binding protein [Telmatobacter bradus]|uniref:4Fe-4S binding protein n=1 Tax=Telmatobacter bradus TaxID=474953 RepID=UPI003B43BE98
MNILRLILQNLRAGTASYELPHKHECTSSEYRGLIHNDETRCIGCAACAYICPTGAIEVKREANTYSWSYDPGKCTFCARCIERCKPGTLSIESKLPPLYATMGELKVTYEMEKKKPAPRPAPAAAAPAAPSAAPAATEATPAEAAVAVPSPAV